jgi:NAD(P)-dependent dehydrogenase (short-subunit alcohol dehydrogenase family)
MTRFDLTGATALVTGASGVLGSALARGLADAGASLLLTGRDAELLAETAEARGSIGSRPADLTQPGAVDELFAWVREHGGIDILINNAGTASSERLGAVTADEFRRVLDVNVVTTYLCAQAAAVLMRDRGGGAIVNIGSIYASVAPDDRLYDDVEMVAASAAYVASKSALVNLTRELAVRLAPDGIRVNMISPGGIERSQPEQFRRRYEARTPLGRMATADDIVGPAIFLASPASAYVTGIDLRVDGGFTAW